MVERSLGAYGTPEQVRADRNVGPAADVFSLGCVLYECLTGRPPFSGEQIVSVLAKILFDEAPDVRALRPGVPTEVAALLARMLAKEAAQRPADGAELRALLRALPAFAEDEVPLAPAAAQAPRESALRGELQELLSVVLASTQAAVDAQGETVQVPTRELLIESQHELLAALRRLGAHADFLLDGSLVAVFQKWSSATDQAAQAAQAALLIHERWPEARIAVTTGRGARPGDLPMGEALERAAHLLAAEFRRSITPDPAGSDATEAAGGAAVRLDEVTTGLIAGRFEVHKQGRVSLLRGPRAALDESRPLLGRPTPCVGRERELLQLESMFGSSLEEGEPYAVLVVGSAGSGKSRLRHEFLRRITSRGQDVLVLLARGAPLSMGTAFGLLGQALRRLCGVRDGDSAAERRRCFTTRITQHLPPPRADRVIPFLAEMSQIEGEDDGADEQLRAARQDPSLMHERLCGAFVELLSAECAARPVLLILEDLHWGDAATVGLVDVALRELRHQPLMVLALARPEVHERFPKLWSKRSLHEMPLWGLGRRACERLIREVLGTRLGTELEERIIAQAAGNALFLEELIRAAAEGQTEGIPETVLAMLQARLGQLEPGARMALCAASIFGSVFWRGGVLALLGASQAAVQSTAVTVVAAVDHALAQLVQLEIIQVHRPPHRSPRLHGEVEYGFRHDLLRDAAYGLLRPEDQVLGHAMAAVYLERAGEREALILAEHHRRGGASAQAARWYHRAAEQALEANELGAAQKRAQSALDAGVQGIDRGRLYGLLAAAAYWQRDDGATRRFAESSLELLPPGTRDYYQSAGQLLVASGRLQEWDAVRRWLDEVLAARPEPGAIAQLALCLSRTGYMFMLQGRLPEMKQIAEQIAARTGELPESEPAAVAQLNHFRSGYSIVTGDVVAGIRYLEVAIAAFDRAGDQRNALLERNGLACLYIETGLPEEAERLCRLNLDECERAKDRNSAALSRMMLGYALTFSPARRGEARVNLEEALAQSTAIQNRRHQGWAHAALARLAYLEGRFAESESLARTALELTTAAPTFQAWPLAWLARALVRLGRAAEGLGCAEQALRNLRTLGSFTMDVSVPALAHIEALQALGQDAAAQQAIRDSKRRLLRRLERITDAGWRSRFAAHPEIAQLLAFPD